MLFNALEEACKDVPTSKWFFNMLVVICAFLSSANTRRKFQRVCVWLGVCSFLQQFSEDARGLAVGVIGTNVGSLRTFGPILGVVLQFVSHDEVRR